jgi:hypothetical protein
MMVILTNSLRAKPFSPTLDGLIPIEIAEVERIAKLQCLENPTSVLLALPIASDMLYC